MAQASSPLMSETSDSLVEAELVDHLIAICASEAFKSSSTLQNLLCHLFYNRDKQLSEYRLAVEALGRREDFDPQVDATVRVQISRLRRRLKDFYLSEGRPLPLRFCIPLGTHQLVLDGAQGTAARSGGVLNSTEIVQVTRQRFAAEPIFKKQVKPLAPVVTLACLSALLAGVCIRQFFEIRTQRRALAMQPAPVTLLPLW